MSNIKNIVINFNNLSCLKKINIDNRKYDKFLIQLQYNDIKSLQVFEEGVLVIKFDNGELRMDITSDELRKMKYEAL